MGSPSDLDFCKKIEDACKKLGVPAFMRITSAHKGPDETLNIIAQYEGKISYSKLHEIACMPMYVSAIYFYWKIMHFFFITYIKIWRIMKENIFIIITLS